MPVAPTLLPDKVRFFRYPIAGFLAALTLLFVALPFLEHFPDGDLVESSLLSLVMMAAIFAVADHHRVLLASVLLVIPALGGRCSQGAFCVFFSGSEQADV